METERKEINMGGSKGESGCLRVFLLVKYKGKVFKIGNDFNSKWITI